MIALMRRAAKDGVLTNAPLRRLQLATAATSLGKWAFGVTLGVYAFRKGGTDAIGLVALIQAVPATAAAPLLGLAGDHYPRQRVLLATNALRALVLGAIGFGVYENVSIVVVFALAALFATISTANQPARAALIPVLARSPREVSSATAVMGAVDNASFVLGAGAGAVLLSATSVQFVIALCCAAYLLASFLILAIPTDVRPRRRRIETPIAALTAGLHTVIDNGQLRLAVGTLATLSIIDGLTNVLVIVTAIRLLHTGTAGVGYLNVAYGAGGLLGGATAFTLLGRSRVALALGLGALVLGVPLIVLGLAPHDAIGLAAWAAGGFGFILVKVSGITLVQRLSGDRVLARVLAVLETTFVATLGLGAILAPALVSLLGLKGALITTGALLPAFAVLRWRALRRLEIGAPVPQREFELLRHCPVFAPLPLAATEGLARRLTTLDVPAGADIITQGEEGDRFYVIASGSVEIIKDGEVVAEQGPGEAFGEIALLRDVPRTATVRALEPTHLVALDREPFLTSVTGHADSHDAAQDVASGYLKASSAEAEPASAR
jgi:predicted MFS family arabinose efflux permease